MSSSSSSSAAAVDGASFYHGRCYCGGIKYRISALTKPNKAVYCHCESCRRAHSAPLYQVVYLPKEDFEIFEGNDLLKDYSRDSTSVIRSFCSNCGSRIQNILPMKPQLGLGFFPATLEESLQHDLPVVFRPNLHYLDNEAVLDLNCLHDGIERYTAP